jgi:2,3-bisphosphoglycerate-dependent phosphoglycerate mutase
MSGKLVLVRHGQSEGNAQNIFTGWRDLPLTDRGRSEALDAAEKILRSGLPIDAVFSSALQRARESATIIIKRLGQPIPLTSDAALNERDYGDLTGLNKTEAADRFGVEQVRTWRRSFSQRPPAGESLQDTLARVKPYFTEVIVPTLDKGSNCLVVAHGNSLRALVMMIEDRSEADIESFEIKTGELLAYQRNEERWIRVKVSDPGHILRPD